MDFYINEITEKYLDELSSVSTVKNKIPSEKYTEYNVKRGLRNSNGTGVLVGLTSIGEVSGYIMEENEKIPAPGKLFYRGIDINDIVSDISQNDRHGFEEVIFLLLFGTLPNKEQLKDFKELLSHLSTLPDGFTEDTILKTPCENIMIKLSRSVLALYSYDENAEDNSVVNVLKQSIGLIAKFPTLAAYGYQAKAHYFDRKSLYIHSVNPEYTTAENFLHLVRPDNKFTKLEADILDLMLILHAEHGGGNNSTFTTHVVSSTGTDIYSAVAAAIGSLKGSKHGGANLKVTSMIDNIIDNVKDLNNDEEIKNYLIKMLKKEAFDKSGLIYGLGHAVYTVSDPRAVLLKKKAMELAIEKNAMDKFKVFESIERLGPVAFCEVKGPDKEICANVDLYSGFVYQMLNIPIELCTPLFAVSRIVGWCAHILEEHITGGRIMRPAYKNVSQRMTYTKLEDR
ncbi:MAG: citrate/2-methylcitrate synthase [Ruminococcaceae bacterium]|nr:citrate/2-methylcitrate synthase [Oscillospiraceae bacterium]